MCFLLLGTPVQDRVADHLNRERVVAGASRGTGLLELLGEDHLLEFRHATAAVFGRPRRGEQAVGGKLLPPIGGPLEGILHGHRAVPAQPGGRLASRKSLMRVRKASASSVYVGSMRRRYRAVGSCTMSARDRYVDLLMGCLTRELFLDEETHDIDLSTWPDPAHPTR